MLGVPEEESRHADRLWRETSHQQMSALFPFVTTMLHLMGVLAIFSDWPGTVTHYASQLHGIEVETKGRGGLARSPTLPIATTDRP
jgi:hypothetical protein